MPNNTLDRAIEAVPKFGDRMSLLIPHLIQICLPCREGRILLKFGVHFQILIDEQQGSIADFLADATQEGLVLGHIDL